MRKQNSYTYTASIRRNKAPPREKKKVGSDGDLNSIKHFSENESPAARVHAFRPQIKRKN